MNNLTNKLLLPLIVISISFSALAQTESKEKVADNIYMLSGYGGNVGVITGKEGLLVIDNGLQRTQQKFLKALETFDGSAKYVFNTHFHSDHSGTNHLLGEQSAIIAHENVRKRLANNDKPYPALPSITYNDKLSLYINGYTLNIEHTGNGHTDGDSIVYIKEANVVHMGDQFFAGSYPYIDTGSGGSLKGYMHNVKIVLKNIDNDTKVIPGHGKLSNKKDLINSLKMMKATSTIVDGYVKKGLTLQQSIDKGLPKKWAPWGKRFINEARWIEFLYKQSDA